MLVKPVMLCVPAPAVRLPAVVVFVSQLAVEIVAPNDPPTRPPWSVTPTSLSFGGGPKAVNVIQGVEPANAMT